MNRNHYLKRIDNQVEWIHEEEDSYRIYSNDNKSSITATFVNSYILITHSSINGKDLGCQKFNISNLVKIKEWYQECLKLF